MASFGDEFLGELKRRCDIETVVSKYVELKKSSSSFVGLCPFHNEKTPSFHVNTAKQFFYCFGCQTGGDVISFIMKIENLSYPEAVEYLASSVGMTVPKQTSLDSEIGLLRKRILEMNRVAARFFHDRLLDSDGTKALDYLRGRALTPSTITRFGLGYSPVGWDNLIKHMLSKGFTKDELRSSGLVSVTEKGMFDRFRDRVMFPIIDSRGNVIGFGGRTMADDPAKYLNTSENLVFHKGSNLYAINRAKTNKTGALILCEGYMDVITLHQAGFDAAVATLGTALTSEQARLMRKYSEKVIICYDSDAAGKNATKRAIEIFKTVGISVKVVTVTGGKDPDEFIKTHGAKKFAELLDGSSNDIEYKLSEVAYKYNIEVESEKTECIKEMLYIIADIRSRVDREIYIDKLSRDMSVSSESLNAELEILVRRRDAERRKKEERELMESVSGKGRISSVNPMCQKYPVAARNEEDILSVLINMPGMLDELEKNITPDDFITDFNRKVYVLLTAKLHENPSVQPLDVLSSMFSPDEVGVLTGYIAELGALDADGTKLKILAERLKNEKKKVELEKNISDEDFGAYINSLKKKGQ